MPIPHGENGQGAQPQPPAHNRTEEAKRISAMAFDSVSDGVVITDADQGIVLVNPAFEAITGYRLQELMDHTSAMLQGPLTNRDTVDAMRHALHQGHAFSGEILNYRKDGSSFWNELSISPLRDNDGHVTHFIGLMRDISERKHAEAAVKEAELRYRDAAEAAGGYILDMDARFRYTFVSVGAEQLLGYAAHEMIGHTPAEFMPPGEVDTVNAWFEANHRPGHTVRGLEHRMLTKSGAEVWLQVSRIPLKDGEGNITGYRGTAFDVTPRKLAEATHAALEIQLREAQKMEAIGTLAGGIAHDFNNIIAAILGNVNLARQDTSPSSPAHESLREIHKAASRARDLVRQILAFSRREQTQYQRTALGPLVIETGRMLRAMFPARVSIEVDCAPATPDISADASQIQQVIINLATNAMQAMNGEPGRVCIGLGALQPNEARLTRDPALRALQQQNPKGLVHLTVSDDGQGIEKALLGRIFDPFFTTKPVGEGTGLGLAVVHGIARGHGGLVVVDSEVGVGTRFNLYFPVDTTSPTPSTSPPTARRPLWQGTASASRPHIVYVDDDEALVSLVKRLLERRGYRVSAHQDQQAALQAVRDNPAGIDLFLTDYNMPGLSGLDLAREVLAIRADLPIGIASGFIDEILSAEAANAGIKGLIFKATSVDEFCSGIEGLLQPKD